MKELTKGRFFEKQNNSDARKDAGGVVHFEIAEILKMPFLYPVS